MLQNATHIDLGGSACDFIDLLFHFDSEIHLLVDLVLNFAHLFRRKQASILLGLGEFSAGILLHEGRWQSSVSLGDVFDGLSGGLLSYAAVFVA